MYDEIVTKQNHGISANIITLLPLVGLFLIAGLTGILPQQVTSYTVIVCLILLLLTPYTYLAYPIVIFYYTQFGNIFGVSVFRVYTIIFLMSLIIRRKKKLSISVDSLIPFYVLFIYIIVNIFAISVRTAIFLLLDIICIYLLISEYLRETENLKIFFRVYCITMFLSFFTGLITNNSREQIAVFSGSYTSFIRFCGTFEDPNYMGFFFLIGVFAIVTLNLFSKRTSKIMTIISYVMIMFGLSITSIVTSIVVWGTYLVIAKKIRPKTIIVILTIFILLTVIYNYGLSHSNIPIVGPLSLRINDKLIVLESRDFATVTTRRSSLTLEHFTYFLDQSIFRILFGGNLVNTKLLAGFQQVAHNEYVDMLLNVGILGTATMLAFLIRRTFILYKAYKKTHEDKYLFALMCKVIWGTYAFTLTMFLDYRFLLLFLI